MYLHPVKKSIALVVLYSIIIVGIFVLQFRNESVISKNFGSIKVSLAQTQDKDGSTSLKNSIQVSFKGISFTADEVYPAVLSKKITNEVDGKIYEKIEKQPLVLESYEETSPLSVTFKFVGGAAIMFTASDNTPTATLAVATSLPEDATQLTMNFKPTSGYSVTEKTNSKQIFTSKNTMYEFSASKITDDELTFSSKNPYAMFNVYDPSLIFDFASVDPDMPIALKSTYDACIKNLKNQLVAATTDSFKVTSSQINEMSVVAYVAEMAAQGKYAEAIESVPESFKKGTKRTYLSAPYFGLLETMQPSMRMKIENIKEMIEIAANPTEINQSSLNIFTVEDLADFIYLFGATDDVKKLLSLPSAIIENISANSTTEESEKEKSLTIAQAAGIIRTYLKLDGYKMNLTEYLLPTIDECLKIIESNCTLTDSSLTIRENDAPISTLLALETGAVLINYGTLTNSTEIVTAGYAITSTVLTQTTPDLMTISEVYPLITNNKNYPHFVMLYRDKNIWTWTVSDSVTYSERNNVGSLTMHAAIGDMHFQIISNIPPFKDINIYGLSYHSDPRFEVYVSSGYVYKASTKSLFIKTRHKAETEIVKLTY